MDMAGLFSGMARVFTGQLPPPVMVMPQVYSLVITRTLQRFRRQNVVRDSAVAVSKIDIEVQISDAIGKACRRVTSPSAVAFVELNARNKVPTQQFQVRPR
jgi:hypothetical protein